MDGVTGAVDGSVGEGVYKNVFPVFFVASVGPEVVEIFIAVADNLNPVSHMPPVLVAEASVVVCLGRRDEFVLVVLFCVELHLLIPDRFTVGSTHQLEECPVSHTDNLHISTLNLQQGVLLIEDSVFGDHQQPATSLEGRDIEEDVAEMILVRGVHLHLPTAKYLGLRNAALVILLIGGETEIETRSIAVAQLVQRGASRDGFGVVAIASEGYLGAIDIVT